MPPLRGLGGCLRGSLVSSKQGARNVEGPARNVEGSAGCREAKVERHLTSPQTSSSRSRL